MSNFPSPVSFAQTSVRGKWEESDSATCIGSNRDGSAVFSVFHLQLWSSKEGQLACVRQTVRLNLISFQKIRLQCPGPLMLAFDMLMERDLDAVPRELSKAVRTFHGM